MTQFSERELFFPASSITQRQILPTRSRPKAVLRDLTHRRAKLDPDGSYESRTNATGSIVLASGGTHDPIGVVVPNGCGSNTIGVGRCQSEHVSQRPRLRVAGSAVVPGVSPTPNQRHNLEFDKGAFFKIEHCMSEYTSHHAVAGLPPTLSGRSGGQARDVELYFEPKTLDDFSSDLRILDSAA